MSDTKIKLGDRIRDRISGFSGIAFGITYWLNGCTRWAIQPEKVNDKGGIDEAEWFDITQVELVAEKVFEVNVSKEVEPLGGPMNDPKF